jgi:hypothetical protein
MPVFLPALWLAAMPSQVGYVRTLFGSENLRPFGQSWRNASARLVPASHVLGDKLMQGLDRGGLPCGNERKYFGVLFNNGEPDYRRRSSSGVSVFERSRRVGSACGDI